MDNLDYVLLINTHKEKFGAYNSFITYGWTATNLPVYWANMYRMTLSNLLILYKDRYMGYQLK